MAEKQIVAATVSVETQAAQRNVLDLNNKVSDLKKELAGAQKVLMSNLQPFKSSREHKTN
jgi:hypothetical protein